MTCTLEKSYLGPQVVVTRPLMPCERPVIACRFLKIEFLSLISTILHFSFKSFEEHILTLIHLLKLERATGKLKLERRKLTVPTTAFVVQQEEGFNAQIYHCNASL